MPMTTEQQAIAIQLRSKGLSYVKIANQIDVSEKMVCKFLRSLRNPPPTKPPKPTKVSPKRSKVSPKPSQQKPKPKPSLLLPHQFHGSCPIHRRAVSLENLRTIPQLTHAQLIDDLARAVRNTSFLKRHHIDP